MFGVEEKIDFYTDGTWLAYDDVQSEDGESMAFIDLYKGTYEGKASEHPFYEFQFLEAVYLLVSRFLNQSTISVYE